MNEITDIKKNIKNISHILKLIEYKLDNIENKNGCVHVWEKHIQSLCIRDNGEYDYKCINCGKIK